MKLTYKHTVLSCYIAYIGSAVINNLASLLFVTFQNKFGITNAELATLITINFGTQILVDFIGAKFVDKVGYRRMAQLSAVLGCTGLILLGVLPTVMPAKYPALIMASMVYAVGSGLNELIISPMIEAIPGDEKEAAMSILHSFYCWGQLAVVLLSTLYLTKVNEELWFILPLLWSVVPLIAGIAFSFVPICELNEDSGGSMPFSQLFKTKIFWLFFILMLCGGAAEIAMSQWASLFAETALGLSKAAGNLLGPCFFALMMGLCRLFYGKFADKLPMVKAIALCSIITIIGYLMVSLIPNPYVSLIGCGVIGFGVGIFWPGVLSVSSKKLPAGGAAMFGILALGGDCGCSLGPQIAAWVSELSPFGLRGGLFACLIFPIVILVSSVAMLIGGKKNTVKTK